MCLKGACAFMCKRKCKNECMCWYMCMRVSVCVSVQVQVHKDIRELAFVPVNFAIDGVGVAVIDKCQIRQIHAPASIDRHKYKISEERTLLQRLS